MSDKLAAGKAAGQLSSQHAHKRRHADLQFFGARLCEPQHVGISGRRSFFELVPGGRNRCGSQTRAPSNSAHHRINSPFAPKPDILAKSKDIL
jgi:hypothetical protein